MKIENSIRIIFILYNRVLPPLALLHLEY